MPVGARRTATGWLDHSQPAAAPEPVSARVTLASAQSAEVQALLASVINWQPRHSLFGGLFGLGNGLGDSTPSSAMSFGPNLLGLLSDAKNGA